MISGLNLFARAIRDIGGRHRRRVYLVLAGLLPLMLGALAVTRSLPAMLGLALISTVLLAAVALDLRHRRPSRMALRGRVAELERAQAALGLLLYDLLKVNSSPVQLPQALVPTVVRTLLDRGDVLDAYLLMTASELPDDGLDLTTLRRLRNELRRRGYSRWALSIAERCLGRGGASDHDALARIHGEIAVLSGEFTPMVGPPAAQIEPLGGRVLHLVGNSLPDTQVGYTLRTHYVALAQRRAGFEPHVVTQMGVAAIDRGSTVQEVDGISYHRLPGPARGTIPLDVWLNKHIQSVADLVRTVRPSVLHAASDYLNALTAEFVGKEFGLPVVYESRGFWEETWLQRQAGTFGWADLGRLAAVYGLSDVYLWRRDLEDRCRRNAHRVVTLSEVMADRIESAGVARGRIVVIPNGVDLDAFPVVSRDAELAASLGIGEATTVIGYISSISSYEGVDTLLAAYAELAGRSAAPIALLVVGDGAELGRLIRQAQDLQLENVFFVGRVPHDRILAYYSLIDVFVVPRKPVEVCHLVTPMKPFEAFATGRTVVMSDVRALARIAERSQAAELFEAGNAHSLADVLAKLIADPGRRRELAEVGVTWVRAHHTWEAAVAAYTLLYEQIGVLRSTRL